jgi:beta-mannosidase
MSSFRSQELSAGWDFKLTDDQLSESWLPVARVPTVVHLDLMDNNKYFIWRSISRRNTFDVRCRIPDTNQDMNELKAHWVGEKPWSYRCRFFTPPREPGDRVGLVFEGLDTFATVQLNEKKILESDNMFIAHHIDVTTCLLSSNNNLNTLQIDFEPALLHARAIRKSHPEHDYIAHQGSPERLGVRKAQYHWGWDWGPKLMTAGPWRPVRLETYRSRIEDISIEYFLDAGLQNCHGTISACVDGHPGDEIRLALRDAADNLLFEAHRVVVGADGRAQIQFSLRKPSLWYPHGYGRQTRYCLDGELFVGGVPVQLVTKRIGFRRAELIQEADSDGKSFYFRINGVDVFAGGSCWIPADNFTPRLSPKRYREWLTLMIEGNQIMARQALRVPSIFQTVLMFSCPESGVEESTRKTYSTTFVMSLVFWYGRTFSSRAVRIPLSHPSWNRLRRKQSQTCAGFDTIHLLSCMLAAMRTITYKRPMISHTTMPMIKTLSRG